MIYGQTIGQDGQRQRMNIIAISGKAGAGKDTVADYLVREKGYVKIGLADPMKRFCKEIFGFSDDQLWGPSELRNGSDERFPRTAKNEHEPWHLTPRYALQQLGCEWGRDCYQDVWIDYALRVAERLLRETPDVEYSGSTGLVSVISCMANRPALGVVISDARFRNELAAVRAAGGQLWRKKGPYPALGARPRVLANDDGAVYERHASESEQDGIPDDYFDRLVPHYDTLDHLHLAVENALV